MDFTLTEAQDDLAELTRKILDDQVTNERLREVERGDDRFDRALWTQLATADVLGAGLPESVGGGGFGLLEQCSVLIELGRAVAPVPYLSSITTAAAAIARFGTEQQRRRWAAPAARGELVLTAALTEEHNPTPAVPSCQAERQGGEWVLTGSKTGVPAGAMADLVLIPASTSEGPRVFVVEPDRLAVQRQRVVDSDSEAWLDLDGVRVGDDRVLGGDPVLGWLLARATVGSCAHQVGVVSRALEMTSEYARERVQFGRPIGSFQAVAQRLADAFIDVEAARLTLWQAAWRLDEGLPCAAELATAKFWAAEAGHRVAHTAVHVHGGVGIDLDHPLHRYFVAAKRNEFSLGAAAVQLGRLGDALAG
ncbi:acyl-CoA dehydrogenase [Saccharopolyspora antimicrobica]|uniref:Acyl-CoA dehydrogenase n=1 Tax=Saccharopolyspora antimicrobica TaxID=455193 RepID=A0A1I5J2Z4_9PSEU|nr:acyl-CoA dehydrogenase family protein [Saccharopolyspora antimicrobica]RKT81983.1 acyl-CoA dehydrogenase [Saccharopolyspora antimicrobica]SFO67117.1 acyl-CoA dehydrogenase [Saccharopolyspora antimicrobica]